MVMAIPTTTTKKPKLTKQEKRWRAEDDARTLATADEIMGDDGRLKSATDVARELAWEARMKAKSMTKIANRASKRKKK